MLAVYNDSDSSAEDYGQSASPRALYVCLVEATSVPITERTVRSDGMCHDQTGYELHLYEKDGL